MRFSRLSHVKSSNSMRPSHRLDLGRIHRIAMAVLGVHLMLSACTGPLSDAPSGDAKPSSAPSLRSLLEQAHVVDLTYAYDAETLYWPTSPSAFELHRLSYGETPAGFFYAANTFSTPEHGGTHLDAPIHFAANKQHADEVPVERLMGPGVVIDVQQACREDRDYRLQVADIEAWEAEHGTIPKDAIVLLHTGWGAYWGDRKAYFGDDTPGDASKLSFPSYGAEAAQLLVEDRQVAVLGVDTASIDYGPSQDFIVHQTANGMNVPGLENVANLERLPATGSWVIALPMKIAGGSGGPVRIVALIPQGGG